MLTIGDQSGCDLQLDEVLEHWCYSWVLRILWVGIHSRFCSIPIRVCFNRHHQPNLHDNTKASMNTRYSPRLCWDPIMLFGKSHFENTTYPTQILHSYSFVGALLLGVEVPSHCPDHIIVREMLRCIWMRHFLKICRRNSELDEAM